MSQRRGKPGVLVVVTFALLMCGACGGDSGDGGAGASGASGASGRIANANDIDMFVGAICDRLRTCCGQAGLPAEPLADCEADSEAQADFYSAVRSGRAVLIEPAFSECLAALQAAASDCGPATPETTANLVCQDFYQGTAVPGEACQGAVECVREGDPIVCLKAGTTSSDGPGICRAMARGRMGDRCLVSANDRSLSFTFTTPNSEASLNLTFCHHGDGLYCNSTRICEPLVAQGGDCSSGQDCALGFYCDDIACQPTKQAGEPCADHRECLESGLLCKEGVCAGATVIDNESCEGDFN